MTIEIEKNEITIKIPQSEIKNRKKGKVKERQKLGRRIESKNREMKNYKK